MRLESLAAAMEPSRHLSFLIWRDVSWVELRAYRHYAIAQILTTIYVNYQDGNVMAPRLFGQSGEHDQ